MRGQPPLVLFITYANMAVMLSPPMKNDNRSKEMTRFCAERIPRFVAIAGEHTRKKGGKRWT